VKLLNILKYLKLYYYSKINTHSYYLIVMSTKVSLVTVESFINFVVFFFLTNSFLRDRGLWMDKKYIQKYLEDKIRIKINLKNGRFYSGIILSLDGNTLLFEDKFGDTLPIDLDSISYIEPIRGEKHE